MALHRKNPTKITTALIAISALLATGLTSQSATAATSAGPSSSRIVVSPSSTNKLNDVLVTADDIVISGFGTSPNTDMVRVELTETGGGGLRFSSVTGLTAVTGGNPINTTTTYDSLEFTASVTDANAALANVQYYAGSSFEVAKVDVFVSFAGTSTDLYSFNKTNEHFYKFVSTAETWTAAKTAAAAATFNGMQGYLATSTSSSENAFLTSRVGNAQSWLGGADGGTTGGTDRQWRWVTGPEAGKRFFDQNVNGISGAPNGSNYTADGLNYSNFGNGEPNGYSGWDENALQITSGGTGTWNDLKENDSTTKIGYVIEFGGMAGDSIQKASTARSITVDVNYPEVKASSGNCVQNIANTIGVTVTDPNGDGSKCIIKFTDASSTTWRAPTGVSAVETLVVAGGGGGGAWVGGGGGAGGVILKTGSSAVSVTAGSTYTVTVGAGGSGASKTGNGATTHSTNGSNSVFSTHTAVGGGGGGSWGDNEPDAAANTGGSGGGGSGYGYYLGAAGTTNQGNAGGNGHQVFNTSVANHHPAAGGGGASASGGSVSGSSAGAGGAGITTNISGATASYGGGGGGGVHASPSSYDQGTVGAGGSGGGGSGAGPQRTINGVAMGNSPIGQAGAANTGGGGGGAGAPSTAGYSSTGGAGGSGVVILSYTGTGNPTITSHPVNASKIPSETATFSVAATSPDSGTLTYQWQLLTTALTATWTDISGATSASYTTGSLSLSSDGYQYRAVVTNTIGSSAKSVSSNAATLTVSNVRPVNVNFTELNFDYSTNKYVNLKKLNVSGTDSTTSGTTISATDSTGKAIGDRVLFKAVTVRGNITVDAIVTTKTVKNATVKNYEAGTNAGGAATNFQADVDIAAVNGYAEFQFEFYQTDSNIVSNCNASITCAGSTKVILENVNISIIDIDYFQWNEVNDVESYTVSNPTNIKECLISGLTSTSTCTARVSQSGLTYPADLRFQGPDGINSTIPQDMAIMNFGSVETFNIKFGRSKAGTPNYYGIAFKAQPWGAATPTTNGPVAQTYTIAYNGNGNTSGTVPASHTGVVGTNFTASGNTGTLARAGYTFGGWNTAADGTGTAYSAAAAIQMPKDGLTLYAVWTANQFTLTYNANGGSGAPVSELRNAGAVANLSATTPTRSGYTFAGWTPNSDGTGTNRAAGASYTMPGANTTLYAKWTLVTTSIDYDGNNSTSGSVPSSNSASAGTSTTTAAVGNLARSGYTFAGWNTAANGSGTDYAPGATIVYPASGTTTLYAQWTAVLYTLSYNANGGLNSSNGAAPNQSANYNATLTLASSTYDPTRDGYTFAGWNLKADGTGTNYNAGANNFSMPAANTVLYAKWTAIDYTLTYNANGGDSGSVPSAATGKNLGSVFNLSGTVPTRTGYRFAGWNTNAGGTGNDYASSASFTMPASNTSLYAKWVAANIKVVYDANGGSGTPPAEQGAAGTGINLSTTVPTKDGFTFLGWCADLSACPTPLQPNRSYTIPNTDTTLYAKWAAISYTFIYNGNGGTGVPASVTGLNVGGLVTVYVVDANNPAPTRTGYSFTGWNAAANGTSTNYAGGSSYRMGASNYTIYAQWIGDPYTLTYNSNGGTAISPTSEVRRADSTANITSTTPTRTGFTFASWNTAANGSGTTYAASASLTMPTSNVTLYAQWTAINSGVSYNANGGSGAPAGSNHNFGATVTVSNTVPSRTGYTFTGWNTQSGGGGTPYAATDTFSMPNSAVVLYAQWSATAYALAYDANGGSGAPVSSNRDFGTTVTVSSGLPTRSGYDFQGWNTEAAGSGASRTAGSTFTMPASNVTLYAQWSLATFTVYFNANGGSGSIAAQPGRFNSNITLSNNQPTRPGYTFSGWNTAPDGSGVNYTGGGTLTLPANNVTLYAEWTAITYTLTYSANGGTSAPAAETGKTTGESFTLSASTPNRTNYWFSGWNTQADGSGTNFSSSANYRMGASNVTLYAVWVLTTHTVSYNANGGIGAPAAQTVGGGSSVTVPASPAGLSRPGYTFSHWYTTPSGTGGTRYDAGNTVTPSGNVVLYAIWTAKVIVVHYNINTGIGTTPPDDSANYDGQPIQLAGSGGFSKTSSTFLNWNTASDGSGTSYAAEDPNFRVPSDDITLYAIWSPAFFAVEFKPNGGTGAPSDQYAAPAQTVVIPSTAPVLPEHEFVAWSDVSNGNIYSAGSTITMPTSNVTLVANYVKRASVGNGGGVITNTPTKEVLTYPKKLNLTVYFKGDRSYLTSATKTAIKKLAATAKKYGYATSITIYGRVKETNDKSYDARLSKARATNVANYLKKLGVGGAFKVIAAGISPENKPISRRVDMELYWKKR